MLILFTRDIVRVAFLLLGSLGGVAGLYLTLGADFLGLTRDEDKNADAKVDDDIEQATQMNDTGRIELAQRDREYLIAELSRAVGLGHRPRTLGSTAERARTSVTRSLRYALERLAHHHPDLAAHLGQTIHTGTYCVYTADPIAPLVWEL